MCSLGRGAGQPEGSRRFARHALGSHGPRMTYRLQHLLTGSGLRFLEPQASAAFPSQRSSDSRLVRRADIVVRKPCMLRHSFHMVFRGIPVFGESTGKRCKQQLSLYCMREMTYDACHSRSIFDFSLEGVFQSLPWSSATGARNSMPSKSHVVPICFSISPRCHDRKEARG